MGIRHSPRTPYAPWTNGLVENQNRNLGTHLRIFLHNTPENWSTQVHMYAYAHNSQPLSEINLSPYEIVFHTIPRIPINFELNLQRDTYRNCTSQYCQELPLHTHYDKSNLNPFFHKILSKPIPQWILATETAMIQIYHTVYENTKRKINSYAYFNKTHSPRTPYAPWTNGLVENQNRNLGTHLRHFLHNTPENWSTQVHMYAYAHNSQPLSELNLSPYEIVFHTIPRIPINFELNLQRDTYRNCTSQYCQELPLHTHYDKSNLNSFFHKILSKPIPQWILATETAMIQMYHTV